MNRQYQRFLNEESMLSRIQRVCINMVNAIVKFARDIWSAIVRKITELKKPF